MVHWINAECKKPTGTATTDYNMDEIKLQRKKIKIK